MTEHKHAKAVLAGLAQACPQCGKDVTVSIPRLSNCYFQPPARSGIHFWDCKSCGYGAWFWPTGERAYISHRTDEWERGQ